ncbi:MAG: protease inhibitor I42 family protein [Dehalococcoidia bacterium]|nr:protease inhibitor I42 family protein [Dehalococcoidia bacterium]
MKRIIGFLALSLPLVIGACKSPQAAIPVINQFYASPASISQGDSCTLNWTVTGAEMVTIEPGLGEVPASGSRTVAPDATIVYELTANTGSVATSADTTVTVSTKPTTVDMPVINLFESTPNSVVPGGIATLVWDVAGASSVQIDQSIGDVEAQDRKGVIPSGTTSYTLTAANASGEVSASTRVVVMDPTTSQMPAELVAQQIAQQVAAGGQFTINLGASPSTGYQWELDYYDPAFVSLVSSEYQPYSVPQMGSTGSQQFVFKAIKVGDTTIKLSYAHPDEPVNSSSKYYQVHIIP